MLVKLQEEIRTAFRSYDEINAISTIPLSYLQAVALEGMRMYPPLPLGLPRVVPAGGDTVDGYFLPGGVRLFSCFTVGLAHIVGRLLSRPIRSQQANRPPTLRILWSSNLSGGWSEMRKIYWKQANPSRWVREVV